MDDVLLHLSVEIQNVKTVLKCRISNQRNWNPGFPLLSQHRFLLLSHLLHIGNLRTQLGSSDLLSSYGLLEIEYISLLGID